MPQDWCPFCPGSGRVPESYDVCLYPNDFPALSFADPDAPGACDVVLYSPQHDLRPSELAVEQWEKVIALWTRRSWELAADSRVKHVMVFENTGEEVGVTMPHPHGQIYAFPFVPPQVEREMAAAAKFRERENRCLYCKVFEDELHDGRRVVLENGSFVAFAPYFARFPYETQIYLRRHCGALSELKSCESHDLASIMSVMRKKYDALFDAPMPLMMVLHQQEHFRVEILPLRRSATKLKYLAAVESASGTFLNDVNPEEAAEALRNA